MKYLIALCLSGIATSVSALSRESQWLDHEPHLFSTPEMLYPLGGAILAYLIAMAVFGEKHNAQVARYGKALRFHGEKRLSQERLEKIAADTAARRSRIKTIGYFTLVTIGGVHLAFLLLYQSIGLSVLIAGIGLAAGLLLITGIFQIGGVSVGVGTGRKASAHDVF